MVQVRSSRCLAALIALFLGLSGSRAQAIPKVWNNPAGGNFNVDGNWTPPGVPGSGDDATIALDGTYTVTLSDTRSINSLSLGGVTGTQTLQITSSARLNLAAASTVGARGVIEWQGGRLIPSAGALTSAGTINVVNAAQAMDLHSLEGPLNNTGTILHNAAGAMHLDGGTLNNQSGGLYELQAGLMTSSGVPFNNQAGAIFRKSTGSTGTVNVNFNNNGGVVDVTGGTLSFVERPFGLIAFNDGTSFTIASGAVLSLDGVNCNVSGTVTGTGAGKLLLNPGALITVPANTSAAFNFSGALLQWQGGRINAIGPLTNAGTINVVNAAQATDLHSLGGTLNNTGTILQNSAGALHLDGATLNNQSGGLYELQAGSMDSGAGPNFNNQAGAIFRKSTSSTSTVDIMFINNGGLVDVTGGTLSYVSVTAVLTTNAFNDGTSFTIASGAVLSLDSGNYNASGTVTGTGAGKLLLNPSALIRVQDNTSATFNFSGALFQWQGGRIDARGPLTNAGTINVVNAAQATDLHNLNGTLNNTGTILHNAAGALHLDGATLNNQSGAVYELQAGSMTSGGGPFKLNNAGTLTKSTAGTFSINPDLVNQAAGTISATAGVLDLQRAFTNQGTVTVDSATLGGAAAYTQTAGTTVLDSGTLIATTLDIQAGSLTGTGTVQGNVANAGTVAPGASPGVLNITGTYTQSTTGTFEVELGGKTAGTGFDQLNATGATTLDGPLEVSLLSGFTPVLGDSFKVMTFASRSGEFDVTNLQLGAGLCFVPVYNGASLALNVVSCVPALRSSAWEGQALLLICVLLAVRLLAAKPGRHPRDRFVEVASGRGVGRS